MTVLLMPACLAAETTGPPSGHGRAAGRRSQCHFCRLPGRWAIDTGLPSLHMADTGRLLVRVICWLAGRCPPANHSCVVDKSASSLGRAAPPCRPHRGQQQHTVLGLLPSPSLLAAAAVQSLTARRQLCSFANWRLQQSAITKRHSSLPCHYFSYRPHALPVLPQFLLSGRCNTKAQVSRREVSHRWCTAWCSRSLCCSLQPC